ncbi:hypothetical protein BS50DRAFT_555499 [Corynespora cassiicola Philippines]|uniref:dihydroneopterin aldolase n=1 Tax=Corynespora cassiicola Philippines TaxID=1448308 RepID=A0A2T2NI48_CORCC|nr:hypothetical protein BS50DRAFT_555499 [Corynespora cassiicola Philippines]
MSNNGPILIRHSAWEAQSANETILNKVSVRNLEVIVEAGVDVWGRQKTQRALISIALALAQSFDSAAAADSLDDSTVHYGKLSKNIQSGLQNGGLGWLSTESLSRKISELALQTAGNAPILSTEIDVFYPKGSMLGDGAGLLIGTNQKYGNSVSRVLYLRNVRVPCIIGVNSNERLQKQPVVVNLRVECLPEGRGDDYAKLEGVVTKAISDSSFETLESLSTMVVSELRKNFFGPGDEGAHIRLRVEKPLAVPFADAPAIEISRPVTV